MSREALKKDLEKEENLEKWGDYEAIIGLEVHAQLLTESKMFSPCPNQFGVTPNASIDPISSGQPGTLPVVNQKAVELGIRAAIALHCKIQEESVFARKHYFYPDLPKNYQISQYERPYATNGHLLIRLRSEEEKSIGITRIHFEEDAGKSIHQAEGTLVDLNRAGIPLIEIVSEPDLRSALEAGQYLRTLRNLLRYIDVCDGNMEEGNFRCDANVSLRKKGEKKLGTKVELKNINSFRYVEKAIEYELGRQKELLETNQSIRQQTRSWNAEKGVTELMREKEEAQDYRYFPDPDLPILIISTNWQEEVKRGLPELPQEKRDRFLSEYGLSSYDADVLTQSKTLAFYFEEVTRQTKNAKLSANWLMNELLGKLNAANKEIEDSPISATHLADLIQKIEQGVLSGKMAKEVFEDMFVTSRPSEVIIKEKGLVQISDPAALSPIIDKVIQANPSQVTSYQGGKTQLFGFFVGQVMKETKGQANPALVNELVRKALHK